MDILQFLLSPTNLMIAAVAVASAIMLMLPSIKAGRGGGLSSAAAIQVANRQQGVWVDIRPAEQFQAGHIAQARSVPLAELDKKAANLPKNKPLIVVGDGGRDAGRAATQLRALGFTDVQLLDGGMRGWAQAALPVTKKA